MKKDYCHVTMLLDRSGSMETIKGDTIGGVRTFITEQQQELGDCTFTLIQFDSTNPHDIVIDKKWVGDIATSDVKLRPRGSTPLLDALGVAIVSTGDWLGSLAEDQRPAQVVFVVVTDGYENASREYTGPKIREMIERQEKDYNWKFIYLGANQDVFAVAAQIGTGELRTAAFGTTSKEIGAVYMAAAKNTRAYRGSGKTEDLNFTDTQRAQSKTNG